jgi:hypothetical protein
VRESEAGILPVSEKAAEAKALAYAPWLRHHCRNERAHRLPDEAQRLTGDHP